MSEIEFLVGLEARENKKYCFATEDFIYFLDDIHFLIYNLLSFRKKQLNLAETFARSISFLLFKVNNEGKTLSHDKRELEKTTQKCLRIMRQ